MAVPKRKTSKSKRNMRRSHDSLKFINVVEDKESGARTIYLDGFRNEKVNLSSHLRSRQEVGNVLRASKVPVIKFRASIVIGSCSASIFVKFLNLTRT